MILDVDIGNSSLKWRLGNAGEFLASGRIELDNLGELAGQLGPWKVKRVRAGCVAGVAVEQHFSQWCMQHLALVPEFARVKQYCAGVSVGYLQPDAFGVDRWLAMLAAYRRTGGACVVFDAGTAFTVDVINEDGRHLGGLILPGVRMMGEALFNRTHGVKVGALTLPRQWHLGLDTASCVENGVAAALTGLVEQVIDYGEKHCGKNAAFWVCGGDAGAVAGLDQRLGVSLDLVLDGLALAFGDSSPHE